MTTIDYVHRVVMPAAYALLPPTMASPEATAMLLAIGLQESKFQHRRQMGDGPARGWWQFEGGKYSATNNVLQHPKIDVVVANILHDLHYPPERLACWDALEHNDILAAVFARLQLWTIPGQLPSVHQPQVAWEYYENAWNPGKPHRATWDDYYRQAWGVVHAG